MTGGFYYARPAEGEADRALLLGAAGGLQSGPTEAQNTPRPHFSVDIPVGLWYALIMRVNSINDTITSPFEHIRSPQYMRREYMQIDTLRGGHVTVSQDQTDKLQREPEHQQSGREIMAKGVGAK